VAFSTSKKPRRSGVFTFRIVLESLHQQHLLHISENLVPTCILGGQLVKIEPGANSRAIPEDCHVSSLLFSAEQRCHSPPQKIENLQTNMSVNGQLITDYRPSVERVGIVLSQREGSRNRLTTVRIVLRARARLFVEDEIA